ncbi:hypothetical protein [Larkinella rosea]|uniref:Uncharacterized protein n=1 Tax=Larkinella rosea TaxID=2025312 RepID=A0A3P1BRX7_9BACT|nr:hypothetical protein [Larkinella rosea]RRB03830.1 hypothetical protein EHT25_09835 [Larkinella rosea]
MAWQKSVRRRGGTYELKNGKPHEKIDYHSWDSTAVGKVLAMGCTASRTQPTTFRLKFFKDGISPVRYLP